MSEFITAQDWQRITVAAGNLGGHLGVFAILSELVHRHIGTGLMTASVFDLVEGRSRRVYTDRPDVYPIGGYKPIQFGDWSDQVLERHETSVTPDIASVPQRFPDFKLIASLGFNSNVNIPYVAGGQVLGTVNLLEGTNYYSPERLAPAMALAPVAILAFLLTARADAAIAA